MLTIGLLGGMRLEIDGREVPPPESRRARTLLTWLALHPGRHGRSTLAGRLRPDAGEDDARRHLRQATWLLGRTLGDGAADLLLATRTEIGLDTERVAVDVVELRAQAAAGDLEAARTLRSQVLLPEHDEDWAIAAREELRADLGELLARHAAAAEARGDTDAAVRWARERASADPLSEVAQTELMRLLTASGDRAAALQVADGLRRRLSEELGVTPSAETRAAIEAVLSDERPSQPRTPRVAARAAGAVRTRRDELPAPLATLVAEPFAGRESLVDRILAQPGDRPRLVLVSGEAGIGKTRLAAAVAAQVAADGGAVLFGRCDEEPLASYQPFPEALERAVADGVLTAGDLPDVHVAELARMLPRLAESAPPAAPDSDAELARYRMFEAVRAALATVASERPTLLVLDDIQWADAGGQALLSHLAYRLRDERLLVLMTFRDAEPEVAKAHPLPRLLTQLRRSRSVEQIALDPLDTAAVAELAGGRDVAEQVRRQTGGNALFVVETLRSMEAGDADMPAALRDLIGQRVERLGDDALAVVRAAAVAGLEFTLRDLRAVCEIDDDALFEGLDRALEARLIREEDDSSGAYQFAHALVADAVYDGMSGARRARLHARLADALAARGAAPAAIAHHLLAASPVADAELTLEWVERAAKAALAALAYDDAAALARRALGIAGAPQSRVRLLSILGDALDRASRREEARAAFAEAADAARAIGDHRALAAAALGYKGLAVTVTTPDPKTLALLREALAGAGDDEPALRARLLAALALEGYYADPGEARRLATDAVALARGARDPGTLAQTLSAQHLALWDADHVHDRIGVAGEMARVARAAGDRVALLQARNWRVIDLLELGQIRETEEEIEAYAAEAAELRLARFGWYVPLWRACLANLRGDFDVGEELSLEAYERGMAAGDGNARPYRLIQRAFALDISGRRDEIDIEALEAEARLSPTGRGAWTPWFAVLHCRRGDQDRAQEWYAEVAADDFASFQNDVNWHVMSETAEAAALLGTREEMLRLRPRIAPYARLNAVAGRGLAFGGPVAFALATLDRAAGDSDAAARGFEWARDACERMGARPLAERSARALEEIRATPA